MRKLKEEKDSQYLNYMKYNITRHLGDSSCNFSEPQLRYLQSGSDGSIRILIRENIDSKIVDGFPLGTRYHREGDVVRRYIPRKGNSDRDIIWVSVTRKPRDLDIIVRRLRLNVEGVNS